MINIQINIDKNILNKLSNISREELLRNKVLSNSDVKEKEYVLYLGVKDSYNLNKKDLKIKYLDRLTYLENLDNY